MENTKLYSTVYIKFVVIISPPTESTVHKALEKKKLEKSEYYIIIII